MKRYPASLALAVLATAGAKADDLAERLTDAGVTPVLSYEGDTARNASGGVTRGSAYVGNLDIQLAIDGHRLAGLPGVSAFIDGLWINGGQPSKLVGDAQGVSNIAAPGAVRIYEAWVQYNTPDNHFSVLAGRYDLNTEFYHLTSADLFLNSSFGIGAEFGLSGFAGPSIWPDPAVGVRFAYKPGANTVVRTAVLDGAPLNQIDGSPPPFNPHNGVLLVAEAAFLDRPLAEDEATDHRFRIGRVLERNPYEGKVAVGAWYYTARFEAFDAADNPTRQHREAGAYVLLDRLLYRAADHPDQRLMGFFQLGIAEPGADRFGRYIGAGLTAYDVFPDRSGDRLGIAAAIAQSGSGYISAQRQAGLPVNGTETAIELSYLAVIRPWLTLQPDLQYVIHPDTDPAVRNATIAQLRFEVTY